jgi:hypothetical protein
MSVRPWVVAAGVTPGQTPKLEARAALTCPKDTFEDTTAALAPSTTLSSTGADGRVSWIFPYNFYLVEEMAALGDSIVRRLPST